MNTFLFVVLYLLFFFVSFSVSYCDFIGSALFWLCVHWSLHIWNDYKGELLRKYATIMKFKWLENIYIYFFGFQIIPSVFQFATTFYHI